MASSGHTLVQPSSNLHTALICSQQFTCTPGPLHLLCQLLGLIFPWYLVKFQLYTMRYLRVPHTVSSSRSLPREQ